MAADRNYNRAQEIVSDLVESRLDAHRVGPQHVVDEDALRQTIDAELRKRHPDAVKSIQDYALTLVIKSKIDNAIKTRKAAYSHADVVFAVGRQMRRPQVAGQKRRPAYNLIDHSCTQVKVLLKEALRKRTGLDAEIKLYRRLLKIQRDQKLPDSTLVKDLGVRAMRLFDDAV